MRFTRLALRALPLVCLAALIGCTPPAEESPADGGAPACVAGEIRPCDVRPGCAGQQVCVGGAFDRCRAGAETCDGADDDCDGRVDEDWPDLGEPCGEGQGVCADAGRWVCGADDVVCSAPAEPQDERCDGLDNDCDGAIDEVYPDLGAPCVVGEGPCAVDGMVVCAADGTSRCDAAPGDGTDEVCDGIDNDCDGTADEDVAEGMPCETDAVGRCAAGATRCVAGETVCEAREMPADERCDGIDDDCDGTADEAANGEPLTTACYDGPVGTAGTGPCQEGARICADGAFGACVGQIVPADEICDGVDEDCDGEVDEGLDCACLRDARRPCYGGPEGTEGVGPCRGGSQVCRADGSSFGECIGCRSRFPSHDPHHAASWTGLAV